MPAIRRGNAAIAPMPVRLDVEALLRVSNQSGRVVRTEVLRAGSDLRARLQLAHANLQLQGWEVQDELRPGAWAFVCIKDGRRLLVAIRIADAATVVSFAAAHA